MSTEKPFQGIATFLKSPLNDASRPIGVFGIPYDGSNSYRPGARFAPNAIRQASMMLTDGWHPGFEINTADFITDYGDIPVSNSDVEKSLDQIVSTLTSHPAFLLDTAKFLFMGGDHTISLAILEAFHRKRAGEPFAVLHFDAHCDTWPDHFGDPIGHGTWVRNVIQAGYVRPEHFIQIGIRSPVDPETAKWLWKQGGTVDRQRFHSPDNIHNTMNMIYTVIKDMPLYISFDIDVLDPSFAPGTGTPEIAGMSPHMALEILERLQGRNIIGMDMVEVCPAYDPTGITSLTAATIMWTVASMMAAQHDQG